MRRAIYRKMGNQNYPYQQPERANMDILENGMSAVNREATEGYTVLRVTRNGSDRNTTYTIEGVE